MPDDKCPACGVKWPCQDGGHGCECCTREYYRRQLAQAQARIAKLEAVVDLVLRYGMAMQRSDQLMNEVMQAAFSAKETDE